jgi:hypothetical protein
MTHGSGGLILSPVSVAHSMSNAKRKQGKNEKTRLGFRGLNRRRQS